MTFPRRRARRRCPAASRHWRHSRRAPRRRFRDGHRRRHRTLRRSTARRRRSPPSSHPGCAPHRSRGRRNATARRAPSSPAAPDSRPPAPPRARSAHLQWRRRGRRVRRRSPGAASSRRVRAAFRRSIWGLDRASRASVGSATRRRPIRKPSAARALRKPPDPADPFSASRREVRRRRSGSSRAAGLSEYARASVQGAAKSCPTAKLPRRGR